MTNVFTHDFVVTGDMLDANSHVNNVLFVQWMQDVAILHSVANGAGSDVYRRLGASWVARSHHIDYENAAVLGDEICVRTWLADARKVSCRRKYLFSRKEDRRVLARAETVWVYVDFKTGRPRKIDAEVIQKFTLLGDSLDTA